MSTSEKFSVNKLSQRGAVQFLVPLILIIGIVAGVYLVQHTQIFKPKAAPQRPANPETSFELVFHPLEFAT